MSINNTTNNIINNSTNKIKRSNPNDISFLLLHCHTFISNLYLSYSFFMEDFRSKSYRDGGLQKESYYGVPSSMQDLRCYSANYANSVQPYKLGKEIKMKKSKSSFGTSSSSWIFNDPELRRKKRVASYKVYAVEGKMKGSLRKSFRWVKNTYNQVVYGWR